MRSSLVAALLLAAPFAQARDVVDATGATVKVADHPARIVTLAPSLAEVAADFVATDLERIVGVSEFTDFPPALKSTTSIGPYAHFNIERVVALKPDLVLATLDGNSRDQVTHLRELGVPVVAVNTTTLSEIASSMKLIGTAIGSPEAGEKMSRQFREGLARIREHARKVAEAHAGSPMKVLLELGDDPLIVVGKGSFLNEALELIGARNLYADTAVHYPRPAFEDAVHRNPDAVIILSLGGDPKPFLTSAQKWNRFRKINAVREAKVHVIQSDTALRPSLRFLEGISILEKAIYGDR